jgi:hypothetical protein
MRRWVDDTGSFAVDARLIAVLDGKVRLLKSTGRTCTVPVERLSARDLEWVRNVQEQYGEGRLAHFADR